jgi:3-deoxy-D-arabino-heptulosonate 7-phosphate (DAHP) synthase
MSSTSKQVTVICDSGHSNSSSNLDVRKTMMRSTVVECKCNNLETIVSTSKQVTVICDLGHSNSSSNLDVQKTMMRSTVVQNDTTSDDIGKTGKRGFQHVYKSGKKSSITTQEAYKMARQNGKPKSVYAKKLKSSTLSRMGTIW